MRLVADTNRVIASLIKDSISRKILLSNKFNFYSPTFLMEELNKYKELIIKKTNINEVIYNRILKIFLYKINLVSLNEFEDYLEEAKELINDIKDTPFIAVAISKKADGIWSDDEHFQKQNKIKIFKTKDLMKFL